MTDIRNIGNSSSSFVAGTSLLSLWLQQFYTSSSALPDIVIPSLQNATSRFGMLAVDLSSGDNVITVPTWAGGALIVPPANNIQTLKLNGGTTASPASLAVNPIAPMLIPFPTTPPASFNLEGGGTTAGVQIFWL